MILANKPSFDEILAKLRLFVPQGLRWMDFEPCASLDEDELHSLRHGAWRCPLVLIVVFSVMQSYMWLGERFTAMYSSASYFGAHAAIFHFCLLFTTVSLYYARDVSSSRRAAYWILCVLCGECLAQQVLFIDGSFGGLLCSFFNANCISYFYLGRISRVLPALFLPSLGVALCRMTPHLQSQITSGGLYTVISLFCPLPILFQSLRAHVAVTRRNTLIAITNHVPQGDDNSSLALPPGEHMEASVRSVTSAIPTYEETTTVQEESRQTSTAPPNFIQLQVRDLGASFKSTTLGRSFVAAEEASPEAIVTTCHIANVHAAVHRKSAFPQILAVPGIEENSKSHRPSVVPSYGVAHGDGLQSMGDDLPQKDLQSESRACDFIISSCSQEKPLSDALPVQNDGFSAIAELEEPSLVLKLDPDSVVQDQLKEDGPKNSENEAMPSTNDFIVGGRTRTGSGQISAQNSKEVSEHNQTLHECQAIDGHRWSGELEVPFSEKWQASLENALAKAWHCFNDPRNIVVVDCNGRNLRGKWHGGTGGLELENVPGVEVFPLSVRRLDEPVTWVDTLSETSAFSSSLASSNTLQCSLRDSDVGSRAGVEHTNEEAQTTLTWNGCILSCTACMKPPRGRRGIFDGAWQLLSVSTRTLQWMTFLIVRGLEFVDATGRYGTLAKMEGSVYLLNGRLSLLDKDVLQRQSDQTLIYVRAHRGVYDPRAVGEIRINADGAHSATLPPSHNCNEIAIQVELEPLPFYCTCKLGPVSSFDGVWFRSRWDGEKDKSLRRLRVFANTVVDATGHRHRCYEIGGAMLFVDGGLRLISATTMCFQSQRCRAWFTRGMHARARSVVDSQTVPGCTPTMHNYMPEQGSALQHEEVASNSDDDEEDDWRSVVDV